MTDAVEPSIDAAQLERIEALRQRRAGSKRGQQPKTERPTENAPAAKPRRRSHPALGSRIAAAGMGATAMFGIVAAMGATDATASTDAPEAPPATAETPPVVVVVHRTSAETSADAATLTTTNAGPIALEANPVVRTVQEASPAPTAQTNGSR